MKAELLMGLLHRCYQSQCPYVGLIPAVEIEEQDFRQTQWHFLSLWMTSLKLLQILTGGGNGWEPGWIVYGMLLPKAFWIMTVAEKAHCPESSPVYSGHSWHTGAEQGKEGSRSGTRNPALLTWGIMIRFIADIVKKSCQCSL